MQNVVSWNLSAQDIAGIDAPIATLRRVFAPVIALQPGGDKSFGRQMTARFAKSTAVEMPARVA